MLLRLVRPMRRKGSRIPYFTQRIPSDLKARSAGVKLALPIGDDTVPITISPKAQAVKVSLRTDNPGEAKIRQAAIAAYLETVWRALREDSPIPLTNRQATALAGRLYRAWSAGEGRERTIAIVLNANRVWEPDHESTDDVPDYWEAAARHLEALGDSDEPADLEAAFGPIIDRLLLGEGIRRVDPGSRLLLLKAFRLALQDAFERRGRNAGGDYTPDPKAERFPAFETPSPQQP